MPSDDYKIVKVGNVEQQQQPKLKSSLKKTSGIRRHTPKKSMRTYPRGVMKGTRKAKIEPTRDPAKAPPMRRSTLKIITEKGAKDRRNNIKKTVRSMSDAKVREILRKHKMSADKAPPELAREIVEGGMIAGMISLP